METVFTPKYFCQTIIKKKVCSQNEKHKTRFTALCFEPKMCVFARKNFSEKMKIGHF